MEGLDHLISDLALILIVAGVTTLLFKKINQPVVLGYIVAGFLTSPHFQWLPSVSEFESIEVWANIGIIFLMFALGLEFSFHKIAKLGGSAIITAITVMSAMILIGTLLGTLMGWSRMDSIFLGAMLSMSSTMIILKAYDELKLKKEKFAQLVLGALVIEDIAAIFMMIILTAFSVSKDVSGFEMVMEIGELLLMLIIVLAIGIYLVPTLLKKAYKLMNNETLLIVSIGFCLGMVVVATAIGFSSALGAFIAGSILAGTGYMERIDKLIHPIKDLFGAIFFVSVGMMVDPAVLTEYMWTILIIIAVTIVGQMIFSTMGVLLSGQSLHTATCAGFSMVQIGEFSFILATLGSDLGVTSDFLYPIIVCVSVVTTFLTPILMKRGEGVSYILSAILPTKLLKTLNRYTSEKRSENEKDDDWRKYITQVFIRILICASALFLIYFVATRWLYPFLLNLNGDYGRVEFFVITLIAMAPFITIMNSRRSPLLRKLWMKNVTNRIPLIFYNGLKIFISTLFVMLTIAYVVDEIHIWMAFIIAIIFVLIISKSSFMKSRTLSIEAKFVANFNERILQKKKEEREATDGNWIDEKIYVIDFGIDEIPEKKATIKSFLAGKIFGVMIIRICRDNKYINLPRADTRVQKGDRLYAMGTPDKLEAYIYLLEKRKNIFEPTEEMVTLRDYIRSQEYDDIEEAEKVMCFALSALNDNKLVKSSIKDSNFIPDYHGFILAIERENLPILLPDKNLIIEKDDLLWVFGTEHTVSLLTKAGLMDE